MMSLYNFAFKSLFLLTLLLSSWNLIAQLPNPVAFYPLNGNANDISGNGLNGTVNGAVPTFDRCGNPNSAFLFDGFSSSIAIDFDPLYDIPPNGQFTISSWVRPTTSTVNAIFVKCFFAIPFQQGIWDYGQYAVNSQLMAGAGVPGWVLLSDAFIPNEQCWTHYVFTYNNGNWKIYLNGILEDEDLTQSNFITQSTGGLAIGKKGESNGDFFNGSIDDVAFYDVELSTSQVLSLFDSQKVTFEPVNSNLTVCSGGSAPLELVGSCSTFQANSIQWTPSSTLNASDIINPIASPTMNTSYQSVVTIQQCPFQSTINVNVINLNVDLGPDASFCSETSIQLNAQNSGANYLWQDGSSNQTLTVSNSGLFWVDVTSNGCTERDSINVTVIPEATLDLGNDTSICTEDTILLEANAPGYNLLWQDGSSNAQYLASTSGIYWVTASSNGCSYTDSLTITSIPAPIVNIIGDIEFCEGQTIELLASSTNGNLLWSTGSDSSSTSINEPGTYSVLLSNICGESSASIEVIAEDCGNDLFIPNAFTPNGDDINDLFRASSQNALAFEMHIFNRYGELVFYADNILNGWNGSMLNGAYYCPDGIYAVSYKALFNGAKIIEGIGHVVLIR